MRMAVYAILLVIMILFVLAALSMVRAHEWYDGFCCNDHDCVPAKPGTVIRDIDPDTGRLGYTVIDPRLPEGRQFVGDGDTLYGEVIVRDIPELVQTDEPYHVCVYYRQLRCVYRNKERL